MRLPPLAVAVLLALSAPASGKDDAAEALDKAKASPAPPAAKPKSIEPPPPSALEVGHVLGDNGVRVEGGALDCPYGGVPAPLFETMRRRSKALREHRARLAGIAWGAVASSEEAGTLYFFEGPRSLERDKGAPAFTAYWKAKAEKDRAAQAANGIAVQQALASDPELARLVGPWWERLEAASAPLKTLAGGMRKAAAEAKAKVEAEHGVALTDELLAAPATVVYAAARTRFGRAVRDCDHWSFYLPQGASACPAAQALFANREAHAAHKDWAALLGQLGEGGAYFVLEAVDPPPAKALTGTFVSSKEDLTPESASACEEGRPKPPVVAASKRPRPPVVRDDARASVWDRLPTAEARAAWDKARKACAGARVIRDPSWGYLSVGSRDCMDANEALKEAGCAMPQDQRLATAVAAGGGVESLAEAESFEELFFRVCPGEPVQAAEEFKVFERWLKDSTLPVELRCHALHWAAFSAYLGNIGGPGGFKPREAFREELRAANGLGSLCADP